METQFCPSPLQRRQPNGKAVWRAVKTGILRFSQAFGLWLYSRRKFKCVEGCVRTNRNFLMHQATNFFVALCKWPRAAACGTSNRIDVHLYAMPILCFAYELEPDPVQPGRLSRARKTESPGVTFRCPPPDNGSLIHVTQTQYPVELGRHGHPHGGWSGIDPVHTGPFGG